MSFRKTFNRFEMEASAGIGYANGTVVVLESLKLIAGILVLKHES